MNIKYSAFHLQYMERQKTCCDDHNVWKTEKIMFLLFLSFALAAAIQDEYPANFPADQRHPDLNATVFPALRDYHIKAIRATEEEFPWIARVIHSRKERVPHMCTATCVGERLFLASSRCVLGLKVFYTRILYRDKYHIPVRAFALPTYRTKQLYDDIAVIITEEFEPGGKEWPHLKLFNRSNRTDPRFAWFDAFHYETNRDDFYVVGYAMEKKIRTSAEEVFNLYKLNVLIDMENCPTITRWDEWSRDYYVPCVYPCNIIEHKHSEPNCWTYLGVDGGAVVDVRTNTLMGISTWGAYTVAHYLPVGFAIPNSQQFHEQFACAKKIREDKLPIVENRLQELCDDHLASLAKKN